jgi:hypothetical protein
MRPQNMFPMDSADGREAAEKWVENIRASVKDQPLMDIVERELRVIAQWTQVTSSLENPTINLVRLAVRRLRLQVDELDREIETSMNGSLRDRETGDSLQEFKNSLVENVDKYFGDDFYNADIYRIAEFLDPRLVFAVESQADIDTIKTTLKNMCHPTETAKPRRQRAGGASALSNFAQATNDGDSPFDNDFKTYIQLMNRIGEQEAMKLDPMAWWAEQKDRMPILARLAAFILSIPATSSDVERLFSITGRIASKARASLSGARVNMLSCLHSWLKAQMRDDPQRGSTRESKQAKKTQRFAELSIALEVIPGEDDEDDNEDEDD